VCEPSRWFGQTLPVASRGWPTTTTRRTHSRCWVRALTNDAVRERRTGVTVHSVARFQEWLARRSRTASDPPVVVPPTPANLKGLAPVEVRRTLAHALRDGGDVPDFEVRSAPVLVRQVGDWTHRIEIDGSRYNVQGKSAETHVNAAVLNRRLKQHERKRGYKQFTGFMWALSDLNLRRESIDPVRDGWQQAYLLARAVLVEDWLPVLDRFQGDDWLDRVRELGDPDVPWPSSVLELLLGDGDERAAAAHLEWLGSVKPEMLDWTREDLAKGPPPPGTARATAGFRIAEVLRGYKCEHLLPAG
jgi:hypothetical protein